MCYFVNEVWIAPIKFSLTVKQVNNNKNLIINMVTFIKVGCDFHQQVELDANSINRKLSMPSLVKSSPSCYSFVCCKYFIMWPCLDQCLNLISSSGGSKDMSIKSYD